MHTEGDRRVLTVVSVVIVCGPDDDAERCLGSLGRGTAGAGGGAAVPSAPIEIDPVVVAPEGSPCAARHRTTPGVCLVRVPASWRPGAARNAGFDAARGTILVLASPRARFLEGTASRLASLLADSPGIGAAQPRLWLDATRSLLLHPLPASVRLAESAGPLWSDPEARDRWRRRRSARALRAWEAAGPVDEPALAGIVLATRRDVLERAGGFDAEAEPGFEDEEWGRRVRRAGFRLVHVPGIEAIVESSPPPSEAWPEYVEAYVRSRSRSDARSRRGLARLLRPFGRPAPAPQADPSFADFDGTPELVVPGETPPLGIPPQGERFVVEIAGDPSFHLAVGGFLTPEASKLPAAAWRALANGRYFARVVRIDALDVVHRYRVRVAHPSEALTTEDLEIGPYRAGDEHSILRLWTKVFRKERAIATWRWIFAENPAGRHVMLARKVSDGSVVAQFAGVPIRMSVRGETHLFAQMVDSMSDPDCRQGLSKPGIFTKTVLRYVETWGRPGEESFGFGLPNRVAYRIGKKTQGYTDIFPLAWRIRSLDAPPPGDPPPTPASGIVVRREDRIDPRIDALWAEVRSQFPIRTIVDRTYLEWRYLRNPDARYDLFFAEREGRLVGMAVGARRFLGELRYCIADWILADGEEAAGRALVAAAEELARASGHTHLLGAFQPIGCAADRLFEGMEYALERSTWTWVGRIYDPHSLDWELLRSGFFLTIGVSDLV